MPLLRPLLRQLPALILAVALAGCGFHLRGVGSGNLPYKTMYISLPDTADVNVWLQRYISTVLIQQLRQLLQLLLFLFGVMRE